MSKCKYHDEPCRCVELTLKEENQKLKALLATAREALDDAKIMMGRHAGEYGGSAILVTSINNIKKVLKQLDLTPHAVVVKVNKTSSFKYLLGPYEGTLIVWKEV